MNWFVVLAPIALLLILLPLRFIGCGLDEAGEAATNEPPPGSLPTPRLVSLDYAQHIPKLTSDEVISIFVQFEAQHDAVVDSVSTGSQNVGYDAWNNATGPALEGKFQKFAAQEPISCDCTATLKFAKTEQLGGGWYDNVKKTVTGTTGDPTENGNIEFTLVYNGPANAADYDLDGFAVQFKNG